MIPDNKIKRYRDLLTRVTSDDPSNVNEIANAVRIMREMEREYPGIKEAVFRGSTESSTEAPFNPKSLLTPHIESFVNSTLTAMERVATQAVNDFLSPTPTSQEPTVPKKPTTPDTEVKGLGNVKEFEKRLYAQMVFGVDADSIETIEKLTGEGGAIEDLCKPKAYQSALRENNLKKSPVVLIEIQIPLDILLGAFISEAKANVFSEAVVSGIQNTLEESEEDEEGDEDTEDENSEEGEE